MATPEDERKAWKKLCTVDGYVHLTKDIRRHMGGRSSVTYEAYTAKAEAHTKDYKDPMKAVEQALREVAKHG